MPSSSRLLLTLLCFLADASLCTEFLHLGSRHTKRWTIDGSIESLDSPVEEPLKSLLVDKAKPQEAVNDLCGQGLLIATDDGTYLVSSSVRAEIHATLEPNLVPFWHRQALYVVLNAVPVKYLDQLYVLYRRALEQMS